MSQATSINPATQKFFAGIGKERAATFLEGIEHLPIYIQIEQVKTQITLYDNMMPEIYTTAINILHLRLQQLEFNHTIERLNHIRAMQKTILPS